MYIFLFVLYIFRYFLYIVIHISFILYCLPSVAVAQDFPQLGINKVLPCLHFAYILSHVLKIQKWAQQHFLIQHTKALKQTGLEICRGNGDNRNCTQVWEAQTIKEHAIPHSHTHTPPHIHTQMQFFNHSNFCLAENHENNNLSSIRLGLLSKFRITNWIHHICHMSFSAIVFGKVNI